MEISMTKKMQMEDFSNEWECTFFYIGFTIANVFFFYGESLGE